MTTVPLKRLAIFDIDGTLTDTNAIDSACFVESLHEFGISQVDEDWSIYPHTTDRAIITDLLRRTWSREPEEHEMKTHRARFMGILGERMTSVKQIPCAAAFIDFLKERGWSIVLCTGAWSDSARLKLERAGLPIDLPISTCDEAESRENIVRNGIAMAGGGFDRIVAFGDAIWDLRAARNLALPFIGVGQRSGSQYAIEDYCDPEAVLRLMSEARAPR